MCEDCPENTYSKEGATTCSKCPDGYVSAKGSKSINSCYINVPGGSYIKNSNDTKTTKCSEGTFKGAHKVYYGNRSYCTNCPGSYTSKEGTASETKCYIDVTGGSYIKNAKSSDTFSCPEGSYKGNHTVYYGQTSRCESCPKNYTSNYGTSSIKYCYIDVPGGSYIKNSNDTKTTKCSKGTFKGAHTVYYGNTSKCNSCAACKTTYSTGASNEDYCVSNYGDGSQNTKLDGYTGKIKVNCQDPLEVKNTPIYKSWKNWGNYRTEGWVGNGNHGYCSDNNIKTYGFRRYWLSLAPTEYIDTIPVTSRSDNHSTPNETCNKPPIGTDVTTKYGRISSGNNSYTFDTVISGEKTVFLGIRGGGATHKGYLRGLEFKVNGNNYTLEQMVNNNYIKPLVILDGMELANTLNLYNGGATDVNGYPNVVIMFMTNPNYNISGFSLYSSIDFSINYNNGNGNYITVNDGYYLRYTNISNWRMTYEG